MNGSLRVRELLARRISVLALEASADGWLSRAAIRIGSVRSLDAVKESYGRIRQRLGTATHGTGTGSCKLNCCWIWNRYGARTAKTSLTTCTKPFQSNVTQNPDVMSHTLILVGNRYLYRYR